MDTPALEHLMDSYLHQDYALLGSIWDNVDLFVVETPDLAPQLPYEVEWAIATYPGDAELRAFLLTLGLQVRPPEESGGYRAWLTEVARRVEAATRPHD